jgi:hypothetical protein
LSRNIFSYGPRRSGRKANRAVETLAKIATALRFEVDALFANPERRK